MMTALRPLLTSKKFQVAVITALANALLYLGIELDIEITLAITSPLVAAIFGQTVVDVKKAGLAGLVLVMIGCGGTAGAKASAGRIAGDFVDCMAPAAVDSIGAFLPAMSSVIRNATRNDGTIDWEPVKDSGRSLKTPAQQCVIAAAIAELLRPREPDPEAPQSAPLAVDREALLVGWTHVRLELYGGTRYRLATGTL